MPERVYTSFAVVTTVEDYKAAIRGSYEAIMGVAARLDMIRSA